jgi:3-carboxy-cis,cis-muconate cycloisomerase
MFVTKEGRLQPNAPTRMYDPLFSTPEMAEVFSDLNFLHQMLRFEVALAEALEQNNLAPPGTAADLSKIDASLLDLEALAQSARLAGNICIPFVKQFTAKVAEINPASAGYVHWGATSQDVIDTATMLQIQAALPLLQRDLGQTCDTLAKSVHEHRNTVMAGRTWLQQGPPVTLGLKLANWLDALQRHSQRLAEISSAPVLQFGGAVGTLAALGSNGIAITQSISRQLGLPAPAVPWHTQRDRIAEIATTLGSLTGTLGKIARDVSLLMQTEVAEFMEPTAAGRGGSSTMPHKRNPVASAVILSAATRTPGLVATILTAMVQEHERGVGGWHAEWEPLTEIFRLTAGALSATKEIALGATVDPIAMQHNLDILHGVTMAEAASFALAKKLGKAEAHRIVETISQRAIQEKIPMQQALADEPSLAQHFMPHELTSILNPASYLGATDAFIDRVLANQPTLQSGESHAKD